MKEIKYSLNSQHANQMKDQMFDEWINKLKIE